MHLSGGSQFSSHMRPGGADVPLSKTPPLTLVNSDAGSIPSTVFPVGEESESGGPLGGHGIQQVGEEDRSKDCVDMGKYLYSVAPQAVDALSLERSVRS